MKKYLSKKYIKYIGSLCAVWAALWNVFLLGVSLEKFGPAAESVLLQCIFDSENYAHDFFTRQFWFISVFVFYMAVYFVIFLFLQHESGKCRSMKLHRYGKTRYLKHCERKVLYGSLYAVLLVAAGLAGIALFGHITGAVSRTGNADMAAAVLLLAKIFLCMVLYGKITVYPILRKSSDFAAFFMLVVLFVHLAAEVYTQKIHFLTYTGAVESLCGILILIAFNAVTDFVVRKKIKIMDLC